MSSALTGHLCDPYLAKGLAFLLTLSLNPVQTKEREIIVTKSDMDYISRATAHEEVSTIGTPNTCCALFSSICVVLLLQH